MYHKRVSLKEKVFTDSVMDFEFILMPVRFQGKDPSATSW